MPGRFHKQSWRLSSGWKRPNKKKSVKPRNGGPCQQLPRDQASRSICGGSAKEEGQSPTLHPAMAEGTPMQATKGKLKKNNKLVQLLQLLVLETTSRPLGAQPASWTVGMDVGCCAEWSREAIDAAVDQGPHRMATGPDAVALVHKDTRHQIKTGSPRWRFGTRSRMIHQRASIRRVRKSSGRSGPRVSK